MKKIILHITMILLASSHVVIAQDGTVDPAFGINGVIRTPAPSPGNNSPEWAKKCFVLQDGKLMIVVQAGTKAAISKRLSDGKRDVSYANSGFSDIVTMVVNDAAMQSDGKIIVIGTTDGITDLMMARFNTNGTLDAAFGNEGIIIKDLGAANDVWDAVTITSSGRIIAGGTSGAVNGQFFLMAFNDAGVPDLSFGNNGIASANFAGMTASLYSLAIQADGQILAAGTVWAPDGEDFGLARFNTNGTPDQAFNNTGTVITNFGFQDRGLAVVVQPDGKICAGGTSTDESGYQHFRIARYNSDGTPDASYNAGVGSFITQFVNGYEILSDICLSPDGTLIASGVTDLYQGNNNDIQVIRLNANGTIDNSFGTNGVYYADINARSETSDFLTVQPDNKIIAGGGSINFSSSNNDIYDISLFRLSAGGVPDAGFGTNGALLDFKPNSFYGYSPLFHQNDGKLLAGSETNAQTIIKAMLSRFNSNGTIDNSFGQNGSTAISQQYGSSVFLPDGRLLRFDGTINPGDATITSYKPDGTIDAGFGINGTAVIDLGGNESVGLPLLLPDGKIIMAGVQFTDNGTDWILTRLNSNGSIDAGFGTNGAIKIDIQKEDAAQGIALQPDGKIVLGGTSYTYPPNFSYVHFDVIIARLNADGTFDNTFGNQGIATIDRSDNDYFAYLLLQPEGKLFVSYLSDTGEPNQTSFLEKINADGTMDAAFGQKRIAAPYIVQQQDKVIVFGNKLNTRNNFDFFASRYNNDGSVDNTFGSAGTSIYSFGNVENQLLSGIVSGNNLFVSGYGVDAKGNVSGMISKLRLASSTGITCPGNIVVSADKNFCSAKVTGIDPIVSGATVSSLQYKLTGATKGNGTGSASGKVFNTGITTITYTLNNDATKVCSFTVKVEDRELPVIENLAASSSTLWPPDHKMKDITLRYNLKDNCGIASTKITVTSNEAIQTNERGDQSPDWQVVDNQHIRIRAERLENGTGRVYTITVHTTDIHGNRNAASVNVAVPKSNAPQSCTLNLTASPNPSNNYFNITTSSNCSDKVYLRLLNEKGTVISTLGYVSPPQTIRLGDRLSPGVYYLEATQGNNKKTIKLVKR